MSEVLDRVRRELDAMRARVDHLRVQAKLGTMELRYALDDLRDTFEPTYERARRAAQEVVETGARESRAIAEGVVAGWDELRRTYREHADRARDADER